LQFCIPLLKALFQLSQKSTRTLATSIFIQPQNARKSILRDASTRCELASWFCEVCDYCTHGEINFVWLSKLKFQSHWQNLVTYHSHSEFHQLFFFQEVTAMAFHPTSPVLVSGSRDFTIKFFDISKPSIKKGYRSIQVAMHRTYCYSPLLYR